MKTVIKLFNIICITILVLLLVGGLITGDTYNHVFFIGPIFFKEIFVICLLVVGIYFFVQKSELNRSHIFLFFSFSILSFWITYLSHPQVKMEFLFQRILEYNIGEEDYNEIKEYYESNNHSESFRLLEMEVNMFRTVYQFQYEYLKARNKLKNPTYYVQFYFFLIFGIVLMSNGLFHFFYEKNHSD